MKYIPVIFLITIAYSCKGKPSSENTARDITISTANSFSELFLDSILLEKFIKEHAIENDAAENLHNFYNSRNYNFAWLTTDGLTEQARGFWNLHNNHIKGTKDSSFYNKQLHRQMELLINDELDKEMTSEEVTNLELMLTEHFFDYAQYAYQGKINPKELQWHIPRKKINVIELLDSLIAGNGKNIGEWEPVNQQYKLMAKELSRYNSMRQNNQEVVLTKKIYELGDSSASIAQVKKKLYATGDYASTDTSHIYNTDLLSAVKRAQRRLGLKVDGVIGPATVKELNVPVKERIQQILLNMERMRWMPKNAEGRRLVANIPEFKLYVFEGDKKQFDIDIVVGKAANKTVIFNDVLEFVVFSPYWNIPRSIIRNEILPAMNRSPGYLSRMNMEQTGYENGLPVIRQKPGGSNSLGRVKFIFPNSYSIYFHDTPAKSLFNRTNRAFSHGCIRLAEPAKLANYLLSNQAEWTTSRIEDAMFSEQEKWVKLDNKVPVLITYFTSWVDEEGRLNFRIDIYGHDKRLASQLFNDSL